MRKKVFKAIIACIIFITVAIGGYTVYKRQHPSTELSLSGNVDIRQVNLSFRVGGRLAKLRVDEGAQIKAGDILGTLDDEPYRIAFSKAEADQSAAQARMMLLKHGYRKEDILQAKANLDTRLAALRNANQLWQRQKKLIETGANSQRNLDDAQSNLDQAKAQVQAAREQYRALHTGFRDEEIEESVANYQRSTMQLYDAALALSDTILVAPSGGIIMTRSVEPGTLLNAGSTVFSLSLTEPVWVRAYVAEPNLGAAAPGTSVKIYTDSRNEPYDGVIGFVSPTAEFTPKNVETTDLRTALVYRLRVVVNNPDNQLRQGMPVTVKLQTRTS